MNKTEFEPMNFLSVIDMSPESAAHFFGGEFYKIVDAGPAPERSNRKPGARVFHCFRTKEAWDKEAATGVDYNVHILAKHNG